MGYIEKTSTPHPQTDPCTRKGAAPGGQAFANMPPDKATGHTKASTGTEKRFNYPSANEAKGN
jgi:hypothetical protein